MPTDNSSSGIRPQSSAKQQHPYASEEFWLDRYKYVEAEEFYAVGQGFFRGLLADRTGNAASNMEQFMKRFDQLEKEQKAVQQQVNQMSKDILQQLAAIQRQLGGGTVEVGAANHVADSQPSAAGLITPEPVNIDNAGVAAEGAADGSTIDSAGQNDMMSAPGASATSQSVTAASTSGKKSKKNKNKQTSEQKSPDAEQNSEVNQQPQQPQQPQDSGVGLQQQKSKQKSAAVEQKSEFNQQQQQSGGLSPQPKIDSNNKLNSTTPKQQPTQDQPKMQEQTEQLPNNVSQEQKNSTNNNKNENTDAKPIQQTQQKKSKKSKQQQKQQAQQQQGGDGQTQPQSPQPVPAAPAVAAKKETKSDDVDLFGSDEEVESEESKRVREERLKQYAAKKSVKPALIAKSNVILDVKPWDDETDMKELEKCVRSVTMDGLLWGQSKLVDLAYGIKKLQISSVVVDEKVSVEELIEKLQEFEDFIQSVDVAAFNKI